MEIKLDTSAKIMIVSFFALLFGILVLVAGPSKVWELMQTNVSTLFMGLIIGAVGMYLLLQGGLEPTTPMTGKKTFSDYANACPEELGFPIIDGQVMFDSVNATYIQKGKYLAYRGKPYKFKNDPTTWVVIIDSTMRGVNRDKSPLAAKINRWMTEDEIMKLMDKLSTPTEALQGKEAVMKTLKEAEDVKKSIEEA